MTVKSRLAIFTICSNNYMPAARTFLTSVRAHHPEADLFVCLADRRMDMEGLYDPDWTIVEAHTLPIQDFDSFSFRYDIMEMNTAVKPFMFQYLLDTLRYDQALYFDPDIEVFRPLEPILGPLRAGASFVLTPHLLAPVENEDEPNDLTIMRAGVYNLGFLGVSACPESRSVLAWWARRLRYLCISAIEIGIFVDQKFMDLVPGFAPNAHISHDSSLNVAYWNLGQRVFEGSEGAWQVDGKKLTFFHYSGFNARKPNSLSKYASRYDDNLSTPLRQLIGGYAKRLVANGLGTVPDGTYAYGKFRSGTVIHPFVREMFRKWHLAWGSNPFETYEAFLGQRYSASPPGPPSLTVTNFMKYLYDRFPSLGGRLVLSNPEHVRELVNWYHHHAERELKIDPRIIRPELARMPAPVPQIAHETAPRWTAPAGPAREVTVIGYLRTASGVGEVGRQTLRSLEAGSLAVEGIDVALNVAASRDDASAGRLIVETSSSAVQIFNINADQLPQVIDHLGARLRPDALRINIPFWELSRYPEPWLAGLAAMDEIWAPSRFIAEALSGRIATSVVHMPVAIEFTPPKPMDRARFGLPEGRFLFFFAFDFLSFIERKNPEAVVAAFRSAFPTPGQAGLVLKCMNGNVVPDKLRRFQDTLGGHPDIVLVNDTLTRDETLALIASTDAVVSLHRSEGLGLLIAEAMLLGKPVIATDYSASQDLLSDATGYPVRCRMVPVPDGAYPFAEGQVWAEPETGHAAELMAMLAAEPHVAATRVDAARRHMETKFTHAQGCDQHLAPRPDIRLPRAPHADTPTASKDSFQDDINREDVLLNRLFGARDTGFFVDVGAAHPVFENDTKALSDRGWRGINIEPNVTFFRELEQGRPRDRNLNLAVGDETGILTFHEVVDTGLSTLDPDAARDAAEKGFTVVEHKVEVQSLRQILADAGAGAIDLLKVDVEGFELKVLASNDWTRFRPSLIMTEATYPQTPVRRPDHITPFLSQHGYRHVYFDGLNDYYAETGFEIPAGVFDVPLNVFDEVTPYSEILLKQARDSLTQDVATLREQQREADEYVASLKTALEDSARRTEDFAERLHAADVDLHRAYGEITALRAEVSELIGAGAERGGPSGIRRRGGSRVRCGRSCGRGGR
eukprot:gene12772-12869_t